jgi:hypothetical protein
MAKSVVCGGEVFFADGLGFAAHRAFQLGAGARHAVGVGLLGRFEQALVLLLRELGVDRQPQRRAAVDHARQLDRELDARVRTAHGLDVLGVLVDRQHLLEQHLQLHFAPGAARLHVGQHAFQVAHADRQLLHLAQALVHFSSRSDTWRNDSVSRVSSVACSFSSTVWRISSRRLALSVLQVADLVFERGAHFQHALGVRFGEVGQRAVQRVGKRLSARACSSRPPANAAGSAGAYCPAAGRWRPGSAPGAPASSWRVAWALACSSMRSSRSRRSKAWRSSPPRRRSRQQHELQGEDGQQAGGQHDELDHGHAQ